MSKAYSKAAAGTFRLNKDEPIHRWYSYLEGYSSCLIDDLVREIGPEKIEGIYDPFGGTGTTALVASKYGISSYYSETNPFMCKVIEAKINCVHRLRESKIGSKHLSILLTLLDGYTYKAPFITAHWDGFEKYFEDQVLFKIQDMQKLVNQMEDDDSCQIARVLLASVIVRASKMIRQGDLRFAKEGEKTKYDEDIVANFKEKIREAIADIDGAACPTLSRTICISEDARDVDAEDLVDCVITSPPYLNGTNYVRNTKLELKLFGFVTAESDLPELHSRGIIAGINNVSKRKLAFEPPEYIQPYLDQLMPVSYDKRIPTMVAGYFHDMEEVILKLSHVMKNDGIFIMDIGDSQFAGVYIPTHKILAEICSKYGFELYAEDVLRERRSKNGMVLSQRLLKFRLHKNNDLNENFLHHATMFLQDMPYRHSPYTARNWGHPWHSLCSYHGKMKPSIAHFMISQFTKPGEVILDPLCGVGTIPFEACLQGRVGIGNDLSELAYIVTKAKLEKPDREDCEEVVNELEVYIAESIDQPTIAKDIAKYKSFGFNGNIESYFHPTTYKEILCARRFFVKRISSLTSAEAMVYSCLLHVLHGNRPYALSRRSHPLTPYSPSGEFVYKSVIDSISRKLARAYNGTDKAFENFVRGRAIWGDYSALMGDNISADAIICSPPFADSMRFYMQNWMRLWLCGWEADNYKQAETIFLDQRQQKDFNIYYSFFEMCSEVLKPSGKIVLHLGKTGKFDMAKELSLRAAEWFAEMYRGQESVETIEKHGIKDKGGVTEHQFLFLQKR